MWKRSRHIPTDIQRKLLERSQWRCEICSMDIVCDKHHIHEFADWGHHTVENLICLCPTCHREIPKQLNEEQQRDLLDRHKSNHWKVSSFQSHSVFSNINTVYYWSNKFLNAKNIFTIWNKRIIWISNVDNKFSNMNNRFYLNILLLWHTNLPNLLILNNKIIHNNGRIIQSTEWFRFLLKEKNTNLIGQYFMLNGYKDWLELTTNITVDGIQFWNNRFWNVLLAKSTIECETIFSAN